MIQSWVNPKIWVEHHPDPETFERESHTSLHWTHHGVQRVLSRLLKYIPSSTSLNRTLLTSAGSWVKNCIQLWTGDVKTPTEDSEHSCQINEHPWEIFDASPISVSRKEELHFGSNQPSRSYCAHCERICRYVDMQFDTLRSALEFTWHAVLQVRSL